MLKKLKSIPIQRNKHFPHEDYLQNKRFYHRQIISKLLLDNDFLTEDLIDCQKEGLMVKNYYWQSALLQKIPNINQYLSPKVYLRQSIVLDLLEIDQFLQKVGLRLFIMSGYRHPDLQRLIINQVSQKNGQDFAEKMFADPDYYAPHTTGAAIDLEIWDIGNNCPLLTKSNGKIDRFYLEDKKDLNLLEKEVRDNRRLIHHLLTTDIVLPAAKVFIGHPYEYWHYGRHERLAAFFAQNGHPIYYDVLKINSALLEK